MKLKITLFFVFYSLVFTAQSLQNQVIGAVGGSSTTNGKTLVFSVGEIVNNQFTDGTNTLSQGFLQGSLLSGIYWNGSVNTDWFNNNNWDGAQIPSATDNVIITNLPNAPIIAANTSTISNLEIRANSTLTINNDGALTIENDFENNGGVLNLKSDALNSGVLFVKGSSTGNVTYKRGGLLQEKWSLVASPVENQKIIAFAQDSQNDIRKNTTVSPNRFAIGVYNDMHTSGNKWDYFDSNSDINLNFIIGDGYSISRASDGAVSFTGTLETENLNKTVPPELWAALGNPYTTYYSINKNGGNSFLADNITKLEIPAVYIWDNNQTKYVAFTNLVSSSELFIAPAQGFFVKPAAVNFPITFNASKRSLKPVTGSHNFNKSTNVTPYFKLYVALDDKKINTDIIFSSTSTLGYDKNEDIENYDVSNFDITSLLVERQNEKNYTIQSIPFSNINDVKIPLNLISKNGGSITFSLEKYDFPRDVKIYLEDQVTNTLIRLDDEDSKYTINLPENTDTKNRFFLRTSTKILSIITSSNNNITIFKYNNETVRITGLSNQKATVNLYDLLGKKVLTKKIFGKQQNDIRLPKLTASIYLFEVVTVKGKQSKKIFIE